MAEAYAHLEPTVQALVSEGNWTAVELAEEDGLRDTEMKKIVTPAPWGACPMDESDIEAIYAAEKNQNDILARHITNEIDERHARCLAGCAIREINGDCVAD